MTKLTRAQRKLLDFIADAGNKGCTLLQITASGGLSIVHLQPLIDAGLVEIVPWVNIRSEVDIRSGRFEPDRVRVTDAGKAT